MRDGAAIAVLIALDALGAVMLAMGMAMDGKAAEICSLIAVASFSAAAGWGFASLERGRRDDY